MQALTTNTGKATKSDGASQKKAKAAKGKTTNKIDYRAPWMKIPPSEGEPSTKEVEGKQRNWCTTHQAWGRHKPEDCRGLNYRAGASPGQEAASGGPSGPAMRINNALSAVAQDDDDDDDDE